MVEPLRGSGSHYQHSHRNFLLASVVIVVVVAPPFRPYLKPNPKITVCMYLYFPCSCVFFLGLELFYKLKAYLFCFVLFCGFYIGNESSRSRLSKWLLFLPGAFTFGLGTWQILRRQEKVILIHSLSLYIPFPNL